MAKVIQFPKGSLAKEKQVASVQPGLGFLRALHLGVWGVAVLMWPLLRWLIALDVFWQFCLMVFRGDAVQFGIHFLCFVVAHYYVAIYRPQGVERVLKKNKFSR